MAEESTAIDALFGGGSTATGDETKAADETKANAPSEEFLKTLHGADGKIDPMKAAQMAWDNKRAFTGQASELADLKKGREPVPDSAAKYWEGFDRDGLKQKAPRAYGGTEADEKALQNLFESARASGMGVKQAQSFAAEYYSRVNELLPERDTRPEEERSKAAREGAVKAHPNGTLISGDVQAWLNRRHGQEAFSEKELGVIGRMLESAEGLGLLWRLSRQGKAAPADLGASQRSVSDPDEERRKTFEALAADPEEWKKNKDAILRKYKRARPEAFGVSA